MSKSQLLNILRSSGLSPALDRLRFFWQRQRNSQLNHNFTRNNPDVVLPPDYMMYESFQINYEKYFSGGRKSCEWLLDLCRPYLDLDQATILDWGCGPARIVRHLPDFLPHAKVHGTDYNRKTIAWCKKAIPKIEFKVGEISPPLPYPDDQFDLIYGISIFTHLSEANHRAWLEELARILKPGGLLFLTTQGDIFLEKLTPAEKEKYLKEELVVRGGVKEGHRVYSAFQPPNYFRSLTASRFEELKHVPGVQKDWGLEQDVFVLRGATK